MIDERAMKTANEILKAVDKLDKKNDRWFIEGYKNGRENGYAIVNGNVAWPFPKAVFSENRNSDEIVVYLGTADYKDFSDGNIPSEIPYKNKKYFRYDDVNGAAKFIVSHLRSGVKVQTKEA